MHVIRKPMEVMLHTWLPALLSALVVSLISFAGVFLLHERCPLPKIAGVILIVAGLLLVPFG